MSSTGPDSPNGSPYETSHNYFEVGCLREQDSNCSFDGTRRDAEQNFLGSNNSFLASNENCTEIF